MTALHKPVLHSKLPLDVSVLQQPMLPLDISVLEQTVLPGRVCQPRAHAASGRESVLKQPVLPGRVFSTETYAASGRICSKAACAAP
jgi:hypothetical protein